VRETQVHRKRKQQTNANNVDRREIGLLASLPQPYAASQPAVLGSLGGTWSPRGYSTNCETRALRIRVVIRFRVPVVLLDVGCSTYDHSIGRGCLFFNVACFTSVPNFLHPESFFLPKPFPPRRNRPYPRGASFCFPPRPQGAPTPWGGLLKISKCGARHTRTGGRRLWLLMVGAEERPGVASTVCIRRLGCSYWMKEDYRYCMYNRCL